jgi:hypothetical protein
MRSPRKKRSIACCEAPDSRLGDSKTCDRSAALWLRGQRDGPSDCHGRRGEPKGQTAGPVAGVGRGPDIIAGAEPAQHSRNAGPGAARSAGDVRVAPRRIVADELRASRHARRRLGLSGFQGEGKQDAICGRAAVGEASDRWLAGRGRDRERTDLPARARERPSEEAAYA